MRKVTAENVRQYLIDLGRLVPEASIETEWLSGGVSNVVLKISPAQEAPFVLKQSCEKLRTKADWFSRMDRVYREAEAQRALSTLLPTGAVPRVLFEDRENYCYAMSAVRPDHAVWKRQLLSGLVEPRSFVQAGELLGMIHARSAGREDLLANPRDTTVFFELRVDPFYHRIAQVHVDLAPQISRLIADMANHAQCLVHADFSPKNLLVHPEGLTLVDHETVHFGDPAFDLGFFFSHLCLKWIALPHVRPQLATGIEQAWQAYQSQAAQFANGPLSRRAVPHLAACLLSRVDGKSPVDYLTDSSHQNFVRELACRWLLDPPDDFSSALRELTNEKSPHSFQVKP